MRKILLTAHAKERLRQRSNIDEAAALQGIADNYDSAVDLHQAVESGPATFRAVCIPADPNLVAFCERSGNNISVRTFLTADQAARSLSTGAWFTKRIWVDGDMTRPAIILMWEQDGSRRIFSATAEAAAHRKIQSLIDNGVDPATIRWWDEADITVGVRRVATVEKRKR
jgi:hypothetical protein